MSDDVDELVDVGGYPEVYADGVGEVQILDSNARFLSFSWHRIDGVYRRGIVASIVRPVASLSGEAELVERAKKDPSRAVPVRLLTLHS
jgi:hypothetical protein